MCGAILCSPPPLSPLTYHLHLKTYGSRQQGRDVETKRLSQDCVRVTVGREKYKIKRGRGVENRKERGGHTLGNGVSDDRTFWGDICEESKRIIFLFPPLQRYLLWHIAVPRYQI